IKSIISRYGYDFTDGLMTDVMALKENGLDVSAINVACGYYRPHQDDEFVSVTDVFICLEMVLEIINTYGHIRFGHIYEGSFKYIGNGRWRQWGDVEDWNKKDRWQKKEDYDRM